MDNSDQVTGNGHHEGIITSGDLNLIVPVIEEQLHISKKIIETGKVHVSKIFTKQDYMADMPVFKEDVVVERKAIGRYIDGDAPGIRLDGDTTVIPVMKEVMVKRLVLVEEIFITKHKTDTMIPIHEVLRKEEVNITRTTGPITGSEL